MGKKTVLICTQLPYDIDGICFTNLISLFSSKTDLFDFKLTACTNTLSTFCKNKLLSNAADSEFDYVFYWNPNILLDFKTIDRLISHDKDVVSALFYARPQNIANFKIKQNKEYLDTLIFPRNDLLKVGSVSLGATLFKTSALKKLKQSIGNKPFFDYEYIDKLRALDEDLFFCKQLEAAGMEVFLDSGLSLVKADGFVNEGTFALKYGKQIQEIREKATINKKG